MKSNQIPLAIADLVFETALRLAQIIDLANPNALNRADDLRAAFMQAALDQDYRLFELVIQEAEMQLHRHDDYAIVDIDRRPTREANAEIAADRLVDILVNLEPARATQDRIASYIALELAGLWYPRLEGMRELTELSGTAYRPMSELPTVHRHVILVKTPSDQVLTANVARGVIEVDPELVPPGSTWMFVPV